MFKILILQAWYNLSDEALEKQIASNLRKTDCQQPEKNRLPAT
jgi:hypothetical protein